MGTKEQVISELLAALKAVLAYEDDRPELGTFGAVVYAQAELAIVHAKEALLNA